MKDVDNFLPELKAMVENYRKRRVLEPSDN